MHNVTAARLGFRGASVEEVEQKQAGAALARGRHRREVFRWGGNVRIGWDRGKHRVTGLLSNEVDGDFEREEWVAGAALEVKHLASPGDGFIVGALRPDAEHEGRCEGARLLWMQRCDLPRAGVGVERAGDAG